MKNNIVLFLFVILSVTGLSSQDVNPGYYDFLKWRMIGPHRGGRTVGAVGVPSQPNTFYIGVTNGGVWKTTDFGRTWFPIFDGQPTGSVGDVAVSLSNPDIIYVGSGEGLQRPDLSVGDGMYKSVNAGKTWSHLGLKDVQQIGGLAIDPKNDNIVFVAGLGHPYGPNPERGVYKTINGGKTWEKVLYKDENTGAIQVTIDPNDSKIIFAVLWAGRQGPWENGAWDGKESGLFKSTDGGNTWRKITNGLPSTDQGLGRIGFCIAPSDSKRMYATVDAGKKGGIYRSEDGGESWSVIQTDERFWGRGSDFAEVRVDPKNPDIVYSANVVTWKSMDGGITWNAFRGAPGGDDYHRIWINPDNQDIILIASDQGAIITVNGGETFSSWYNQPTAQLYHVSTDNAFPYNVYGGQQESGSVGIASRGNDGSVTFREWHPVGVEEYGYVAADPLNPDIIYGGKISRYDKKTGQTQNISPEPVRSGKVRFIRTAPVLFNPIDNKTLYLAGNVLFKTLDGGQSWQTISPDLSRPEWDIPESVGIYSNDGLKTMPRRGVIYTVAPSYKDINTIWCGTDDGLIHVTRDGGKKWTNVTPPSITSWSKVSLMDASHYDANGAYAAVNRIRCDDMRPHIYKTNDGGKSWKEIVNGLPNDPINVVREDPKRKGLLYAGSETAVYVSFDDGDNWQSLRLNMPATSIRDLVIKDNDLVVGTHGRSFWILDNIMALRQLNTALDNNTSILFNTQKTFRVRWNMNTDTPLPQEEPFGENPPDGAMIDYFLGGDKKEVVVEIRDLNNKLIRKFSNHDTLYKIPDNNVSPYWLRTQGILSDKKGSHRITWDMHYEPLNEPASFPIAAIYKNTAPRTTSPWVMPGKYSVNLIADGKVLSKPLTIKKDPRVKTSIAGLQLQHDMSMQCYETKIKSTEIIKEIKEYRQQLLMKIKETQSSDAEALKLLIRESEQMESENKENNFTKVKNSFSSLLRIIEDNDNPPTAQAVKAVTEARSQYQKLVLLWNKLKVKK
ncbi:MAG: glycoside hydrolase [Saprospiraceae bacterium]